jgi:hypothetical protein
MLYDKGKIDGALIIAPKGVYQTWCDIEIPTHLPKHIEVKKVLWRSSFMKDNKIVSKQYNAETKEFESEDLVNDFFEKRRWKTFVLFSIIKYVDLVNLSTSYRLRYADITEKYEERDNKLEEILK